MTPFHMIDDKLITSREKKKVKCQQQQKTRTKNPTTMHAYYIWSRSMSLSLLLLSLFEYWTTKLINYVAVYLLLLNWHKFVESIHFNSTATEIKYVFVRVWVVVVVVVFFQIKVSKMMISESMLCDLTRVTNFNEFQLKFTPIYDIF